MLKEFVITVLYYSHHAKSKYHTNSTACWYWKLFLSPTMQEQLDRLQLRPFTESYIQISGKNSLHFSSIRSKISAREVDVLILDVCLLLEPSCWMVLYGIRFQICESKVYQNPLNVDLTVFRTVQVFVWPKIVNMASCKTTWSFMRDESIHIR